MRPYLTLTNSSAQNNFVLSLGKRVAIEVCCATCTSTLGLRKAIH